MYSKNIEEYKKKLKLSKQQREILIGLLLGDGHLETQNNGRTFRLKVEHSLKQKDYVDWLYGIWRNWTLMPPQTRIRYYRGKRYDKYYFTTVNHGSLRFYGQQFYRAKRKIVPKLIHKWITPLSLAIWFMDDGSIKSKYHNAKILNTQAFSKQETKRLAQTLVSKYKLKTSLRKQKEGYQIMIAGSSAGAFISLIERYIIPSMRYKITKKG